MKKLVLFTVTAILIVGGTASAQQPVASHPAHLRRRPAGRKRWRRRRRVPSGRRRRFRKNPGGARISPLHLSVKVTRRTRLWRVPGKTSVGEVLAGTYLPLLDRVMRPRAHKCLGKTFYVVGPRLFVCATAGRPSYQFPHGIPQPVLPSGRILPVRVFSANRDGVSVYRSTKDVLAGKLDRVVERGFSFAARYTSVKIGKQRYLVTTRHEYVPKREVWERKPSQFQGIHMDGKPQNTPGCVTARKFAWVWDRPGRGKKRVGRKARYDWVTIYERKRVGKRRFVRIGENQWLDARLVRRFIFTTPPRRLSSPDGKWIEVLTGRWQTLVAYEGTKPVFATLVSTGRHEHQSPEGLFRIWIKIGVDRMNNHPGEAEMYLVEAVPWIMYFYQGFALHGAYWHDGFGSPRSHGCINLSPKDAKTIFDWTTPALPPGWHSRWTDKYAPGTLVRIRRTPRQKVFYKR
ncbi:MAG: L,D-transpeptidase [Deltaproteobacteria bacterium]|nr:L,D-transpeptidase [Deltaproteobacteria bacterium]